MFVHLLVGLIWFERVGSFFCAEASYERITGVTMDILPSGNIFRELQDIHDTGYFSAQPSLEDHWQQVRMHLLLDSNHLARCRAVYTPVARFSFRPNSVISQNRASRVTFGIRGSSAGGREFRTRKGARNLDRHIRISNGQRSNACRCPSGSLTRARIKLSASWRSWLLTISNGRTKSCSAPLCQPSCLAVIRHRGRSPESWLFPRNFSAGLRLNRLSICSGLL